MFDLVFITENKDKFKQAKKALSGYKIRLIQKAIKAPEIQDVDVRKVAEFSAKYIADKLGKPVVTQDSGYYIKALSEFPGPLIKYINQWFKPEDILNLMEGKKNRKVEVLICVAYCKHGKKAVSFVSKSQGKIAYKSQGRSGSTIDKIYIPHGHKKTLATFPQEERLKFWNASCWKDLAEYLKKEHHLG